GYLAPTPWTEEIEAVGLDDNFFDLGGDSILMTGLLVAVERRWQTSMPNDFFATPMVAMMVRIFQGEGSGLTPQPGQAALGATTQVAATGLRTRLYRRLFEIGPTVGRVTMPYGLGARLQRMLLRRPALQARYPRSVARVREWHGLVQDSAPVEEVILHHLMVNTWREWRTRALVRNPQAFARWVTVEGHEHIAQAVAGTKGIILVTPHTYLGRLVRGIPAWQTRESMTISASPGRIGVDKALINEPQLMGQRAQQLMQARALLARNGLVRIVGDGQAGVGGMPTVLGDRQWAIRFGAAELALETGACLLPIFAWMQPDGHVTLHVCAPLGAGDEAARGAAREAITAHYAQLYGAFWPRQYPAMEWGFLAMYLAQPRVGAGVMGN
ncbi:MAG: phosphopantetheine-binding protein, partial [Litorilinea sp.]